MYILSRLKRKIVVKNDLSDKEPPPLKKKEI